MNIRFATEKDKDQILHLLDEMISEVNKNSKRPPKYHTGNDDRSKIFHIILNDKNKKMFVVEENNNLIAYAELHIIPNLRRGYFRGEIEGIIVTERMRRKGIGTKLFDAIKAYCKEHNIKIIKLTSGLQLENAHRFYERHGGKFTEKMYRFEIS